MTIVKRVQETNYTNKTQSPRESSAAHATCSVVQQDIIPVCFQAGNSKDTMMKLWLLLVLAILVFINVLEAQKIPEKSVPKADAVLPEELSTTTTSVTNSTTPPATTAPPKKPKKSPKKGKKKVKKTRPPAACPDTCTLKRRIGKVESTFASIMDEAKYSFSSDIADLKRYIKEIPKPVQVPEEVDAEEEEEVSMSAAPTVDTREIVYELQRNLSHRLDRDLHTLKAELRTESIQNQASIRDANEQLKELMRTVPAMVVEATKQRQTLSNTALSRTMASMNRTFVVLQSQNIHLSQQTQALRQQNMEIRAQNSALERQNQDLRSQMNNLEIRSGSSKNRLRNVEDLTGYQNSSIYRIDNKQRWMEKRVDSMEGKMVEIKALADEAKIESSEASLDAKRAVNDVINLQRGRFRTTTAKPETTTLPQPDIPPRDCSDILQMGYNKSGIYRIRPTQSQDVFEVYCDMKFNGGGWTYIQKRRDGSVDFNQGWHEYTHGFGDVEGEFWLGNQKIHDLTALDSFTLQIVLLDQEGNRAFAQYNGFRVQGPNDYYSLRFGRFVGGNAGDGLRGTAENGARNLYLARFSTMDSDQDSCRPCIYEGEAIESCSKLHNGGWWYRACTSTNLNGKYIKNIQNECGSRCFGLEWETWHSEPRYSLKASIMMVRKDVNGASPPNYNN